MTYTIYPLEGFYILYLLHLFIYFTFIFINIKWLYLRQFSFWYFNLLLFSGNSNKINKTYQLCDATVEAYTYKRDRFSHYSLWRPYDVYTAIRGSFGLLTDFTAKLDSIMCRARTRQTNSLLDSISSIAPSRLNLLTLLGLFLINVYEKLARH